MSEEILLRASTILRMRKSTVGRVFEVTIPAHLIKRLGWEKGDVLRLELIEVRINDKKVRYVRICRIKDITTM